MPGLSRPFRLERDGQGATSSGQSSEERYHVGLSLAVGATPPLQQGEACNPPPPRRERHSNCRPGALSVACCPPQPPPSRGPQAGSGLPELLCCEQGPLKAPCTPQSSFHMRLWGRDYFPHPPFLLQNTTGDREVKAQRGCRSWCALPAPVLAWRAGEGAAGAARLSLDREGGCGRTSGGQPGGLQRRWPLAGSPEPWPPRALAPGQPGGKGARKPAVAFSWVMGHHDSFNFRNTISGREIARFRGKNTTISSNSISTRGNYSNGDL